MIAELRRWSIRKQVRNHVDPIGDGLGRRALETPRRASAQQDRWT